MDSLRDKRFYKVISLFIKAMILIFSFWYIWQKIKDANDTIGLEEILQHADNSLFIFAFLLMFLNWGLEALKWKMLIAPLEVISFRMSVKAILAGVTISIFSPNRIGEFAGRIFFLEKADKIKASIASMIGSTTQLLVTILAGIIAYMILEKNYYGFFQAKPFLSENFFPILITVILVIAGLIIFIYVKRDTLFLKFKNYIHVISNYSWKKIGAIMSLSVFRYFVFSLQYYLILKLFGINAGITILCSLIALTFFVTSAIPTFALTEIAVRGATATFFFSTISNDSKAIVTASLLLWIINLVVPALIGSIYIRKLKFFKS